MKKLAIVALVALAAAAAFAKPKETAKGQVVDSGTWGIFVNGARVASEKFQIEQSATVNTITTETRTDGGDKKEAQRSQLQVSPTGQLLRYEWHEITPGKAEAVVEPGTEFLIEHMTPDPPDKPREIPFLVSNSTMVVDDSIFTHREVLAWRYLAGDLGGTCTTKGDIRTCTPAKSSYGVIVPKQGVSDAIEVMFAGKQTVTVKGAQRELNRFDMNSEATGQWQLWMDDNNRLVMISIPDAHTEVVRD